MEGRYHRKWFLFFPFIQLDYFSLSVSLCLFFLSFFFYHQNGGHICSFSVGARAYVKQICMGRRQFPQFQKVAPGRWISCCWFRFSTSQICVMKNQTSSRSLRDQSFKTLATLGNTENSIGKFRRFRSTQ